MIAGVMVFLAVVSFVLLPAAWAADRGFRRLGLPTRWVWLTGLAAPFALLLLPLVRPEATAAGDAALAGTPEVFELAPIVVGGGVASLGLLISVALGGIWLLSSVAVAVGILRSQRSLTREREAWPTRSVAGRSVYVSADRGPAVAGVLRPWIVLPEWALRLPHRELDFVLLHEEEHLEARDTLLLAAALAMVTLTPWSPGAWLHLRGLKVAMEVDCDRRVLRRSPDRATYGESLLAVASRASGPSLGLAAFTEKGSSLKTRIIAMTDRVTRWTAVRSILFVAVACLVGIQACYVESPILIIGDDDEVAEAVRALIDARDGEQTTVVIPPPGAAGAEPPTSEPSPISEPDGGTPPEVPGDPPQISEPSGEIPPPFEEVREAVPEEDLRPPTTEELAREPTFTPFTVAPTILNRTEVVRAMAAAYPPLLRDAGIGGTARVYFFIDEEGVVRDYRLDQSTGHPALDEAALSVADVYRFSPALNRDDPTPVWVSFPITFQTR